jgi:uncharacterized membrane protein YoaK (UPF0700 family)
MLIREGDQRSIDIDIRLAALLAAVAGALNAAGFHAAGLFSANMTGNVSALADYIGLGRFGVAGIVATLVCSFILGAFVSGLLIEAGRQRGVRAIYAYSITLEAGLLVLLGLIDMFVPDAHNGPPIIVGLSFIMGLQNAATTRISGAKVRTTHVSGLATDLGLALAALINGRAPREEILPRLRLFATTILAFFLGGVVGVGLYLAIDGLLFFGGAVMLALIALPEVAKARRS